MNRSRALVAFLIWMPVASGCTLWYLASDPYGGAEAVNGSDGATTGDANGADGCVPSGTATDCETCGHACAGDATCVKKGETQHCGAVTIESTQPLSLAVSGNQVFMLDQSGSVWSFADDIAPDGGLTELYTGGVGQVVDGLAVDHGAVYWANPAVGIEVLPLDGGATSRARADVHVYRIAHEASRLAWTAYDPTTNKAGLNWSTVDGGVDPLAGGGFQLNGVDQTNVVLAGDGNLIGWVGDNVAHVDALLGDGGNQKVGYSPVGDGGSQDLTIEMASNGDDVFFTWGGGGGIIGSLYWLPAGADAFTYLTPMTGPGGAAVFAGNGLVYWAGTNGSISYCDPHAGCSTPKTLTLSTSGGGAITHIVATPRYIFFLGGGHVYRIEPFPP